MKHPRLLVAALLLGAGLAHATIDVHEFRDAGEEARYRGLIDELRCPKCQNTNLAGSDAELAGDLKERVYEQVRAGRSDAEIRDYLIARYGDFITYKPPLRAGTFLLWWGPLLLLVGAGLALILRVRGQSARAKPLSTDEKARLQQLLAGQSDVEPKS
ncbi:MAG: cytochrome c-type biogenesis protein [Perlucidibaca sp.]